MMHGLLLRGIPFPILAAVAVLWISAAVGLVESGGDWIAYTDRGDSNPFTEILLFSLMFADLVNAALGLAIQFHQRWARSTVIGLCIFRSATTLIAAIAGETSPYLPIAINLTLIVLMLFPSSAAWCDR
ncbi:hypothetical protein L0U85_18945 [Glycomyces sp. L485]|uniref:hypothetical protein n=1 Tax=Glycomyces sp. L485 TaxID=2909235 RepID=UPI001F4B784E|nr:hypothetical protein [Glycomyces sp. L485]MCH7232912.1 hypothetical protein [Glycomyces sp. L485]